MIEGLEVSALRPCGLHKSSKNERVRIFRIFIRDLLIDNRTDSILILAANALMLAGFHGSNRPKSSQ